MFCKNKRLINRYVLLIVKQEFGENTYSKNINKKKKKKTLQGFEGDIYSKNSSMKKIFFCISYI